MSNRPRLNNCKSIYSGMWISQSWTPLHVSPLWADSHHYISWEWFTAQTHNLVLSGCKWSICCLEINWVIREKVSFNLIFVSPLGSPLKCLLFYWSVGDFKCKNHVFKFAWRCLCLCTCVMVIYDLIKDTEGLNPIFLPFVRLFDFNRITVTNIQHTYWQWLLCPDTPTKIQTVL